MSSLENEPIPMKTNSTSTAGAGRIVIDLDDPRAREPLVDLRARDLAGENYYARADGANAPYNRRLPGAIEGLFARAGVAERLTVANLHLAALGVELFILDAYRPLACQRALWDFFWQKLRNLHPRLPAAKLTELVRTYVSDPRKVDLHDPATWPAHTTGGAVDVMLRDQITKKLLDFGSPFDDPSPISHSDFFERALGSGEIPRNHPPLIHRRILYNAMAAAGFANYPYEYWHFDYGDQLFVLNASAAGHCPPNSAFYPPIEAAPLGVLPLA